METDPRRLQHAAWFMRAPTRIPLALALVLGAVLSVTATLAGYGRQAAKRNHKRSRAELLSFAPPPVPAGSNAAPGWRAAYGLYVPWTGAEEDDPESLSADALADPKIFAPGSPLRQYLTANSAALTRAQAAAKLPHAHWGLNYAMGSGMLMPHLARMRNVARLIRHEALLAAHQSDGKKFEAGLRGMAVAAQHVESDPMVMSWLVGQVIRQMAATTLVESLSVAGARPDVNNIRALKRFAVSRMEDESVLPAALRCERAMGLEIIDRLVSSDSGFVQFVSIVGGSPPPAIGHSLYCCLYLVDRAKYAEVLTASVQIADYAAKEKRMPPEHPDVEALIRGPIPYFGTSMLAPGTVGLSATIIQTVARWRLAVAALAAYGYRLDHDGTWPAKLADAPVKPEQVADPFDPDGGPVRYRVRDDGSIIIWSIGQDQKDGGGKGERTYQDDLAVEVRDPSKTRGAKP